MKNYKKRVTLFLAWIALLLTITAGAQTYEKTVPHITTPVQIVTGPEGIELDQALKSIAETAGFTYLSRGVPEQTVKLHIESMPFYQAWQLLMSTYGDGIDHLFINKKIVVVAPPDILARISPPKSNEMGMETANDESLIRSVSVKNTEGLAETLPAFFPGVEIRTLPAQHLLLLKGKKELLDEVQAFLQSSGLIPDTAAAIDAAKLARVYNLRRVPTSPSFLEAVRAIAHDATLSLVPEAKALVVVGSKNTFARIEDLLKSLNLLASSDGSQSGSSASEPRELKVYPAPNLSKAALSSLELLIGDSGTLQYADGFLYLYGTATAHKKLSEALNHFPSVLESEAQPNKTLDILEVIPFQTLLTYQTTLKPSILVDKLKPLFPSVRFEAIDENHLLVVTAAPEDHKKLAMFLPEIDRRDPEEVAQEEAARRQREAEAEGNKPVRYVYKVHNVPVDTLRKTLEVFEVQSGISPKPASNTSAQQAGEVASLQISADPLSNQLIILGPKKKADAVLDLAQQLDVEPKQAAMRVWVELVDRSAANQLGIEWKADLGKFLLGVATGGAFSAAYDSASSALNDLSVKLSALEQTGKSRRLLDTNLLALSAEQAQILSGGTLLLPTSGGATSGTLPGAGTEGTQGGYDERNFGLNVALTPYIPSADNMLLEVQIDLGEIPQQGPISNSILIPKSSATSKIRIKPGVPVILGGVIGNERRTTHKGIPVLKDIPLIGGLFRWTETNSSDNLLLIIVQAQPIGDPPAAQTPTPELKPKQDSSPTKVLPPQSWEDRSIRYRVPIGGSR